MYILIIPIYIFNKYSFITNYILLIYIITNVRILELKMVYFFLLNKLGLYENSVDNLS